MQAINVLREYCQYCHEIFDQRSRLYLLVSIILVFIRTYYTVADLKLTIRFSMTFKEIIPILQLSIGPVILISGVGLILLSITNRYGRVIDRARKIAEAVRIESETDSLKKQRTILVHRAYVLRLSILFSVTSILFAALLVIALFVAAVFNFDSAKIIIFPFIACLVSLVAGVIIFMIDVNISLRALQIELEYSPKP